MGGHEAGRRARESRMESGLFCVSFWCMASWRRRRRGAGEEEEEEEEERRRRRRRRRNRREEQEEEQEEEASRPTRTKTFIDKSTKMRFNKMTSAP